MGGCTTDPALHVVGCGESVVTIDPLGSMARWKAAVVTAVGVLWSAVSEHACL
jgi:hypothetical protein